MGHCAGEIIGETDDKLHKKKALYATKDESAVKILTFQIKLWMIIVTIMHLLLEIAQTCTFASW